MGILDNLTEPPVFIPSCKVRTVMQTLDADDTKILLAALDNPKWNDNQLVKALAEKEIFIDNKAMKLHRTTKCSCRLITNA